MTSDVIMVIYIPTVMQKPKGQPESLHSGANYKRLSESLKRTCNKYGVQVHFKGGITTKNLLMAPKGKDPIMKKNVVIYRYKCDRVECDEEYIVC